MSSTSGPASCGYSSRSPKIALIIDLRWLWVFDDFVVDFSDAFEEEVEGVFGGVGAGDDQGGFNSFDSVEEFVDGFFGAAGALDGEALEHGVELPRLLI